MPPVSGCRLNLGVEYVPEQSEQDTDDNSQNLDAGVLGFLVHLDQAIQESGDPEEPLEQGHKHDSANNSAVNNLGETSVGQGFSSGQIDSRL